MRKLIMVAIAMAMVGIVGCGQANEYERLIRKQKQMLVDGGIKGAIDEATEAAIAKQVEEFKTWSEEGKSRAIEGMKKSIEDTKIFVEEWKKSNAEAGK